MSLIERAVNQLAVPDVRPVAVPASEPASVADAGATTIEHAMARTASNWREPNPPAVARAVEPVAEALVREAPEPISTPSGSLVEVNLESLRSRGFVTPDAGMSAVAQEFRIIKRPLLTNAFGKGAGAVANGRRLMVTSALPNEGKSFCAINLAMSIAAERDHQVLLVDADVARPSLPRELGVVPQAGLLDLLIDGDQKLDDYVHATNVDKLSLLMAGRAHEHATELIASDAMSRLLDRLSARFPDRIIIFDSPPLLITTESRVLASYMGQIALVVAAGSTARSAVDEALEMLGDGSVVGLVLNKSRESRTGTYYGYQGYGYGSKQDRRA